MNRSRTNLKTVAKALGLSLTTVSRAPKDGPEVRPETIKRVKSTAGKLGYVPNQGGLILRTGRSYTIALILSPESQSTFPAIGFMFYCQGILRSLQDSPYTLTIQPRLAEEDLLKPIMRIVDGQLADGIIIGQIRNDNSRVRHLQQHQFPFVTFGRTQLTEPHAFNDFLHEWITEDSVQRLSKLGHQRVALINPPEELNYSGHRLNGFLRGLESCGLCAQEEMQVSTDLSFKAGRKVLR